MIDDTVRSDDEQELEVEAEVIEIEAELADTREDMGETLGEIGERLDPGRLAEEAGSKVREATIGRVEDAVEGAGQTAKGAADMLVDTVRRNPIPAAMAGAGLFLLWRSRNDGQPSQQGYRSSQGQMADLGSQAQERAQQLTEGAGQLAEDVAISARQGASQLGSQVERMIYEAPFVAGIAALGAGAAVGALLPDTQFEQELIGERSQEIVRAAGDAAAELGEKAEEAVAGAAG